jgi:hypothetical protein
MENRRCIGAKPYVAVIVAKQRSCDVSGWTWDDVHRRNLTVFGDCRPSAPAAEPEKPAKDVPERLIALECEKLLAEDGWRTLRCEPVSDRTLARGFGEAGMPDLLCLRYGRQGAACEVLWLEFKSSGGRVRKHQLAWHQRERACGALTAIAGLDFVPSVKGFRSWYRASGLARVLW